MRFGPGIGGSPCGRPPCDDSPILSGCRITAVIGCRETYTPQSGRLCAPRRLCPLESNETRPRGTSGGPAVFLFSSFCAAWLVSIRLGRWHSGAGSRGMANASRDRRVKPWTPRVGWKHGRIPSHTTVPQFPESRNQPASLDFKPAPVS